MNQTLNKQDMYVRIQPFLSNQNHPNFCSITLFLENYALELNIELIRIEISGMYAWQNTLM